MSEQSVTERDLAADRIYGEHLDRLHVRTDRMFGILMLVQLVAGILAAIFIAPRTWSGASSSVHIHVWASIALGTAITAFPLLMITFRPGSAFTRHTVAVAQMLFSSLLIHLSGGRIEAHFHIFGSLAFLAVYRDWKVLVPATLVVAADHIIRGIYWPQSVFGVIAAAPWRAFEHAGWVLFEDIVLVYTCVQGSRELRAIAVAQANTEHAREIIEDEVKQRTEQLVQRTAELRASEERYALAERGTQDGLWDWNLLTNKIYYAPRWKELMGLEATRVTDSPNEWFGRIASSQISAFHHKLTAHIDGVDQRMETELEINHPDGNPRWVLCRSAAVRDAEGRAIRLAGSLVDITELKLAQEKLRKLAQHDRLTGLPNRSVFLDRLREEMSRTKRDPSRLSAVLFFDFDRFKLINDGLGHNVGDAMLVSIADRFRKVLRGGDLAARVGGDEFVVLLSQLKSRDEAIETCKRLLADFAKPHEIAGRSVVSTASIGLVFSDLGYEDAEEMIRDADVAMYQAKLDGRSTYREFDATMHAAAVDRLNLEQDLRRANLDTEFTLMYQPIASLSTGEITAVEALVRWNHPTLGMIEPDQFIRAAEEIGIIVPLGEWIMREACRQCNRWEAEHGITDLGMSVNLSRRQLIFPGIPERLRAIAEEHGVPASRIRIEVTETDVMDERCDIAEVLREIQALGFPIAMDDFGTGHSSLWCLHKFPLDILKIDRSFVSHMKLRREFTAVMQAIISLSHNLNLKVIAEGVESEDQLAQLQAMDCEFAQGFLFSRPVPASEIVGLLGRGFGRSAAA